MTDKRTYEEKSYDLWVQLGSGQADEDEQEIVAQIFVGSRAYDDQFLAEEAKQEEEQPK